MSINYSIVIPLKNEEENIKDLIHELCPVMALLQTSWELICVDDGSTDKTVEILKDLKKHLANLRIISFDKNYGQSSAFDAGFKAAKGDFIITLDGDRQNDPKDIPKLIQESVHADLVIGRRVNRQDPVSKRILSKAANFIRSRVCQDGVQDTGCSLKLYRRSCFEKIKLYQGMHRFFPALFKIEGFRIVEVPVNHRERRKGSTKYTFFNRAFSIADMLAVSWMRSRHLNYRVEKEY